MGEEPRLSPACLFQGASLLQRSKSFCQTKIETLLDGEDGSNELIGDFTKVTKEAPSRAPDGVAQVWL